MCTVSMVAQDWHDRMGPRFPDVIPNVWPPQTTITITGPAGIDVSRAEFDALKAELESLKKLLGAAKQYDTETGQKDCEDAEKIALFKKLGELCGVDIASVFR
jgi:hypothetical protein